MDRIILGIMICVLGAFSYHLWDEKRQLAVEIREEKEKAKIQVTSTMLTDVTEFTFMKVTNQFDYFMDELVENIKMDNDHSKEDRKKIGPKWQALYRWNYTFNFGFKIPEGWEWCLKKDDVEGIVELNAPLIKQLNNSAAAPKEIRVLNTTTKKNLSEVSQWIQRLADNKMKEVASAYLENKTIQDSVERSLGNFFQTILNNAHKDSNPIKKVIVHSVAKSQCT